MPTDVLREAVAMEVDGMEFFERASRMMTRERSRDMFLGLVAQEKRHVEILGRQLGLLDEGLDWAKLEDVKDSSASPGRVTVFEDRGIKRLQLKPGAGELEVIDLGIEVEKKSIEYYRIAGQETENTNAKEVFEWLVSEESGHLLILQAERDNRSGSGFHYDNAEFSLETE